MRFEIVFSPEAVVDLKKLEEARRSAVLNAIEMHLRHEPSKTSRSRIKRLRGMRRPQYRLRVEGTRLYYDVEGSPVEILAVVEKSEAESWLTQSGETT